MELDVTKAGLTLRRQEWGRQRQSLGEAWCWRRVLGGHVELSSQEPQVLWAQAVAEGCCTCRGGLSQAGKPEPWAHLELGSGTGAGEEGRARPPAFSLSRSPFHPTVPSEIPSCFPGTQAPPRQTRQWRPEPSHCVLWADSFP